MALDASIPLGIKPYQGADIQSTMQTAGGMLNLMQNQQHLQANQIFSDAYKQSTDPQTGETDYGKLQALVSQSPAAAFLPEFMGKIASQRNQQVQYDTGKLGLAIKQQEDVLNRIGSLRAMPGFGTDDMSTHIQNQLIGAVKAGTLPVDAAMREMDDLSKQKTPQDQASWINNHFVRSLDAATRARAMMPQSQTVNTGGHQYMLNVDPLTGKPATVAIFNNELSPGEASTPTTGVTPEGTPYSMTREEFVRQSKASGQPQQQGQLGYSGRMQSPPAANSSVPAGTLQTGLSPAVQAQQTAEATAIANQGVGQVTELSKSVAGAPMRINLLTQAQQILGNTTTGPGTEWRNNAKSLINSTPVLGDMARAAGLDPNNIKNYDEFNKIMTQYANGVSAGLGGGTDARLNAALTGNPNPKISTLANQDILAKTIAAEKMQMAQNYAFQNSGVPQSKFQQWQSQWNANVNPDAFVFTSMNPKQQQDFIKRQSPQQLAKFKSDLGNMVRSGVITMPGQ